MTFIEKIMATINVGKEKAPEANTIIATASASAIAIATPISNSNKEEDRESYDDEPAETIKERLWGLTEMFPEPVREFTSGLICLTARGIMRVYRSACSASWICFTTSLILFAPVIFETERAQVEEMQKMKHKQVLLGSGVGGLPNASALSAINIKDFNHIRDIAGKIRGLFIYEMTKFGHRISLPPEYLLELYKLFHVRNGVKYDRVRPVDFWRHLQIVREKTLYHSHWELLERWLSKEKLPKFIERFANAPRRNLYECNGKTASPIKMATCVRDRPHDGNVNEFRLSSRLQCLPHLPPTNEEIVFDCKDCLPP
uniref:Mitochondrial import receptor subunit TOM22 homolog n=1 Tax=Glossina morsitans morsitans TaxID=37546 RepID=A0A1B0FQJ2_GLOMM